MEPDMNRCRSWDWGTDRRCRRRGYYWDRAGNRYKYAEWGDAPIADGAFCRTHWIVEQVVELERLRQWKREALVVLAEWEKVWEAAGRPGRLGESKAVATLNYIERYVRSLS